jgi:hypothetical protein
MQPAPRTPVGRTVRRLRRENRQAHVLAIFRIAFYSGHFGGRNSARPFLQGFYQEIAIVESLKRQLNGRSKTFLRK